MSSSLIGDRPFQNVGKIVAYINRHTELFGFPPSAIGLPDAEACAVVREMGGDGRCTNLKARISGVLLVDTSL